MPYQDTYYTATFQALSVPAGSPPGTVGTPQNLTGASLSMWIAPANPDGSLGPVSVQLVSNGPTAGLQIPNPVQGLVQFILTKAQTKAMALGTYAFDCMRTDQVDPVTGNPEPQRLFGGFLFMRLPVTALP